MKGFLLSALLIFCLGASAETFGTVTVERLPGLVPQYYSGCYAKLLFRVRNRGAETANVDFNFRLVAESSVSAERSVSVPAGGMREIELFAPVGWPAVYYSRGKGGAVLDVAVDGRPVRHRLLEAAPLSCSYRGGKRFLVSASLPAEDFRMVWQSYSSNLVSTDLAPEQWPVHLRNYLPDFAVILTGMDDRFSPETEKTVMQWVFSGGTLVRCLSPEAPWPEKVPRGKDEFHSEHFGLGKIVVCRPFAPGEAKKIEQFRLDQRSGKRRTGNNEYPKSGVQTALTDPLNQQDRIHAENGQSNLGLPVPKVNLPVLFGVMLAFVILIGPVNYFYLKRRRKEMLLLATVPAGALAFTLAVILFVTFGEGWRSRCSELGRTFLDQTTGMSFTEALFGVYAPVPPRGLEFGYDDLLNFLQGSEFSLSLTGGQNCEAGVIRSRMPAYYAVRTAGPHREKLDFTLEKGVPNVVNGLGVRVEKLCVVWSGGTVYRLSAPLEAGARAALVPAGTKSRKRVIDQNGIMSAAPRSDWTGLLPPMHYSALVSAPVFCSPGFRPDELRAEHAVIGKFQIAGQE